MIRVDIRSVFYDGEELMTFTLTSFYFLVFISIGALIYYLTPKRGQWVVLLTLSVVYYFFAASPVTILFLVASTAIAYVSGISVSMDENDALIPGNSNFLTITAILLNAAIWFTVKWSGFIDDSFSPMGMGYYTAQIIGYIMDVRWKLTRPEKNPLKLFLFVSFFPQLTVGPISKRAELESLFEGHQFSYHNIAYGAQRILWGFMKKLVISDRLGIITGSIWKDTESFGGCYIWIAVLLFPLQLYTDFSGCMDIVLGTAEIFGINLPENFRNPFFSGTVQEFWQRWHITLGRWARDYVYYPTLRCKLLTSLSKACKKRFGKRTAKLIPWTLAMAVLWFVMGFWHGAMQHIIGVSLYFFLVFVISEILSPLFSRITVLLKADTESFSWRLFKCVRTYIIYSIGAIFFSADGIGQGVEHFTRFITSFSDSDRNPWIFFDNSLLDTGITLTDIHILVFALCVLLVGDLLREKYGYARNWIGKQGIVFRWMLWIGLFFLVLIYGQYGPGFDASEFIYQGF